MNLSDIFSFLLPKDSESATDTGADAGAGAGADTGMALELGQKVKETIAAIDDQKTLDDTFTLAIQQQNIPMLTELKSQGFKPSPNLMVNGELADKAIEKLTKDKGVEKSPMALSNQLLADLKNINLQWMVGMPLANTLVIPPPQRQMGMTLAL